MWSLRMSYEPRFVPLGIETDEFTRTNSLDSPRVVINRAQRTKSWRELWQPTIPQLVPRYQGDRAVGGEHHATFLGKGAYGYVVAAVDTQSDGAEVAVKLNIVKYAP